MPLFLFCVFLGSVPTQVKPINLRPGGMPLDTRSDADLLELRAWRMVKNFGVIQKGKLCRTPGWDRLLTRENFNNQDFHDQLLDKTGHASRNPITFLFEAISSRKSTKLLLGTSNLLAALNLGTGNYKILSDRLDWTKTRAAVLSDIIVLTNSSDPVQHTYFDGGITEPFDQSVAPIQGLLDIGISKAGIVIEWQGHVFVMNVVVDGAVHSNSAYWCNYQKPLDWQPNDGSTAGQQDLAYGETILGAIPLSTRLLIFTNKSIWEVNSVGGQEVFAFSKRYDPQESEGCLFYPNTLISIGNEIWYAGIDGLYTYSLYQDKPQRQAWMHDASFVMFEHINKANCDAHRAAYNAERKEVLFSYAKNSESIPSETLVLNPLYQQSYVLDHGFSAMVVYTPKEPVLIIRDFLKQYCICTEDDLNTVWGNFVKEGGYCRPQPTITCNVTPTSIYTTQTKTITYDGETVDVEDYDQAEADADSLCGILNGLTLQDLCESESRQDECNSGVRFVVASSQDYCLKEFSQNYYREMCVGFTGCGTYERRGYRSLLRSGPISGQVYQSDKEISRFELEASTSIQTTPSQFFLRIGRHSQSVDPNADDCGILWDDQETRDMQCLGEVSAEQHKAENTIPGLTFDWPVYYSGNYLYFELEVINPNANPVDTGGACCISRISLSIRTMAKNW